MGFAVQFPAWGPPGPALICDHCARDIDPQAVTGYALWGARSDRSSMVSGAADCGFVTVPPAPDDVIPGSLTTVLVACSETCRIGVDDLIREMSGGFEHRPEALPLKEYLDALREVLGDR
jgi:hypothetical protein